MRSLLAGRRCTPWIALLTSLVAIIGAAPAFANNNGTSTVIQDVLGEGIGSCSGAECHPPASSDVAVTLSGPAFLSPGETATYTIMLQELMNPGQQGAGMHVYALVDALLDDMVLSENDPNAQVTNMAQHGQDGGEITHLPADVNAVGVFSYSFQVTAPQQAMEIELIGNMNAFDGDGEPTGDKWNGDSLVITVPEPASGAIALAALASTAGLRRRRRQLR